MTKTMMHDEVLDIVSHSTVLLYRCAMTMFSVGDEVAEDDDRKYLGVAADNLARVYNFLEREDGVAVPLAATDADQALADILEVCDCCKGGCAARERIEALRGRLTLATPLATTEAGNVMPRAANHFADRLGLMAWLSNCAEVADDINRIRLHQWEEMILAWQQEKADHRPILDAETLTDEQCAAIDCAAGNLPHAYNQIEYGRKIARAVASVCRLPAPLPEPEDVPSNVLRNASDAYLVGGARGSYRVFRDWLMKGGAK